MSTAPPHPSHATIDPAARARHLAWLLELTQVPTAAGREQRVIAWIQRWLAKRPALALTRDPAGNLHIAFRESSPSDRPLYVTAHLDHPAFVVERVLAPTTLELAFRGGVLDAYFPNARLTLFDSHDTPHHASIESCLGDSGPGGVFKHYLVTLDQPATSLRPGDVGVWTLPPAEIIDGQLHTAACDDLAALAAALAAADVLLHRWGPRPEADVRLLFTRAEEVGFLGAIAATRDGTLPRQARVLALENSRSFAESPLGAGPIVRVGDRLSVFSPTLTDAVAKRAEELAAAAPTWKWQRKLMAGGACEASVFCHAGLEATCVCLPLGNYHNMGDLAAVQAGTNSHPPTIEREFISVADFEGLVDLLVACAQRLPDAVGAGARFESLWNSRRFVLDEFST